MTNRITRETKVCEFCNKTFQRNPAKMIPDRWSKQRFCSIDCRDNFRKAEQAKKSCACGGKHYAKGMCSACYKKEQKRKLRANATKCQVIISKSSDKRVCDRPVYEIYGDVCGLHKNHSNGEWLKNPNNL